MEIRRVVAGHDENGKAVILSDGDAANVHQPTSTIESTLLWVTDSAPASNEGTTDTADQEIGIPPPPNGSIFRVVEFAPEGKDGASEELEYLAKVGTEQHDDARHPGMHITHSVDYAIIMSGEIDMLVDEDEASRFVAIYNEYVKAKKVTQERMYLETMEKVLADIDKVIIDKSSGAGVVPYLPLPELRSKEKKQ